MSPTLLSLAQTNGAEGETICTSRPTVINGVHLVANPNVPNQTEHVHETSSQPYYQAGTLHAKELPTKMQTCSVTAMVSMIFISRIQILMLLGHAQAMSIPHKRK